MGSGCDLVDSIRQPPHVTVSNCHVCWCKHSDRLSSKASAIQVYIDRLVLGGRIKLPFNVGSISYEPSQTSPVTCCTTRPQGKACMPVCMPVCMRLVCMPVCMHETGPRKKEAFPTPTESFILEGGNIYLVFNASCHQKHPPTEWLNFLQQTHDSNYPSRSSWLYSSQ